MSGGPGGDDGRPRWRRREPPTHLGPIARGNGNRRPVTTRDGSLPSGSGLSLPDRAGPAVTDLDDGDRGADGDRDRHHRENERTHSRTSPAPLIGRSPRAETEPHPLRSCHEEQPDRPRQELITELCVRFQQSGLRHLAFESLPSLFREGDEHERDGRDERGENPQPPPRRRPDGPHHHHESCERDEHDDGVHEERMCGKARDLPHALSKPPESRTADHLAPRDGYDFI